MLQLGNSAAWNGIITASDRSLETIVIQIFSRKAADEIMSECLKLWSKPDKFMSGKLKWILSDALLIHPVVGFIKQHMDSKVQKCSLTDEYDEIVKVNKTWVPRPQSR